MHDVVVIGGGVVGCAVARELSRYDLDIVLLEKSADVGAGGSTKANTAIVHAGFDAKEHSLKAKFNVLGNKMYDQLCEELEIPFQRNTSLVVAFEGEDLSGLEALKKRGEDNGVPGLYIIDQAELRRREPHIGSQAVAALVAPTGGIVCPFRIAIALAENAAENGVNFILDADVKKLEKEENHFKIILADGTVFHSKTIVNCAGVESAALNNQLSAHQFEILPRRGEYYLIDKNCGGLFKETIFQMPSDKGKGIVVVETIDGNVLLGPTAEDMDPKTQLKDKSTTRAGLDEVLEVASRSWEDIPKGKFITNFSGVRARSSTDDFVIGEAEDVPGFFNAAGIESPGLTSAPAIGVHLAELVSEKLGAGPKENFQPRRSDIRSFREASPQEREALIAQDSQYGQIVCRCETITEAEIRQAIRRPVGARNMDAVKRRVRAGAGRCQAGFCSPRVVEILCEELGLQPEQVTKFGGGSQLLVGAIGEKV